MPTQNRNRRHSGATQRARSLRVAGNMSEARLWIELKDRRLGGYKFVRQFPIGPFVADFACRSERLVVEVDGSQHADSETDKRRDDFMRNAGFSIARFWNIDVLTNVGEVCETILAILTGSLHTDTEAVDFRFRTAGPK